MKFHIQQQSRLKRLLLDDSKSLEDIADELKFTVPLIRQKITELAINKLNHGEDMETVLKETRAELEDIELLKQYERPEITRIRELIHELASLIDKF